ncbi:helix-turn-helix domain-containing protein [Algibacillus agarilyticus]|uniref:helix-turn-helix domain-containing protein n=1 Tax=Algibacillus agarilyticus TaxID=2234133 RepID=UPI000DD04DE2|nr:transcriptional regulator [Algibacillus agarilyticus]
MEQFIKELTSLIEQHVDEANKLFTACTSAVVDEFDLIKRAELIDHLEQATNATPALGHLSNALLDQLEQYEYTTLPAESRLVLHYLMKANKVKQKDLADIATQSIISEILNGKRRMTVKQIKGFSQYFSVPVTVFMND